MSRETQLKTLAVVAALFCFGAAQTAAAQTARAGKKVAGAPAQAPKAKNHGEPVGKGGETVESIYARNLAGLGGAAALARIKSHIMRGHVTHSLSPIPGSFEAYYKSSGEMLLLMNTPMGQFIQAFDGQTSWVQTPLASARLPTRGRLSTLDPAAGQGRYRQPDVTYKVKGRAKVGDRQADLVEAVIPKELSSLEYFDTVSGLLLRIDTTYWSPDMSEKVKVNIHFDSYAEVDGVKVPVKLRYVFMEATLSVNIYEVKHNVAINDALFTSPVQASKK